MELKFQVQLKILKPVAEVFEAVVNPKKLAGYFVQSSSGPLTEGATVKWKFAESAGEQNVTVRQVMLDDRLVFEWPADGYDTRVEMAFKALSPTSTLVQIRESGWKETPKGLDSAFGNCGGWMHMMTCLKAYLEHGLNLRAGGAL
jgi:uncharacterized protein YndB with AHSA1/START domain